MSIIAANLQAVRLRIAHAAAAAQRDPASILLLAVSKTFPAAALCDALAAGQTAFGENYLQEALDKMAALQTLCAGTSSWHFIGPIQSNKTRAIAEHFDWVHSVDRLKVAQRLSEQRPAARGPLNVCVQVNISCEASKSGVLPSACAELAHAVAALPNLRLAGLMAIPAPEHDPARQRLAFARVAQLRHQLQQQGLDCRELSMGMSADLEAAITAGATIVRVGSAIFGARELHNEEHS